MAKARAKMGDFLVSSSPEGGEEIGPPLNIKDNHQAQATTGQLWSTWSYVAFYVLFKYVLYMYL